MRHRICISALISEYFLTWIILNKEKNFPITSLLNVRYNLVCSIFFFFRKLLKKRKLETKISFNIKLYIIVIITFSVYVDSVAHSPSLPAPFLPCSLSCLNNLKHQALLKMNSFIHLCSLILNMFISKSNNPLHFFPLTLDS